MKSLLEHMPRQYRGSPEVAELQAALQPWADKMHADRDILFAQFYPRTATWGLRLWEVALGIGTDISRPYSFRRSRIESKLRGLGTTTKAMVQNVAESFSNGSVEVLEFPGEYRFDIIFAGTIGIPPNMDDLSAAIEEIKPAHLVYGYVYVYNTHSALAGYKHEDMAAFMHQQIRDEVF